MHVDNIDIVGLNIRLVAAQGNGSSCEREGVHSIFDH